MKTLPVFMNISDRPCLIVGGGDVAARKILSLQKAEADITVLAPAICDQIKAMIEEGKIKYKAAEFNADDLDGFMLVIAATNSDSVNKAVSISARAKNIPVNVVDNPALCSFIMPSVINRAPVQIAISTGGASPVLARLLRARLETMIPSAYGRLAELTGEFRNRVKEKLPDMRIRRRFWEQVLQGPIAEMLFAGQEQAALRAMESALSESSETVVKQGEVYLVGGGPGDPDLLTFRALRLMQQAEVVLYDRLVAPEIVDLTRKDADRIYVGKESNQHAVPQEEINQLLIKLAQEGKRVLRLKGGDPFIFGRGGEEIDKLSEAGISFQVVPGITSAAGCAAYSGIPLTHRDYAHTCVFITGHMKDGKLDLNWDTLIQPRQTIAIYMGVKGLGLLCTELIRHGLRKDIPAAIIQQGTRPGQKVYTGTLQELPEIAQQNDVKPPSMVIVGEVVTLHDKLSWFQPGQ